MVDFYTCCTNGNMNKYCLGELQNLQLYHVQLCLYTIPKKNLKTHKTAHFDTNCPCILMLNVVNGKNESV